MNVWDALLGYQQALDAKRRIVRRPSVDIRAATLVALSNGGVIAPHPLFPDAPQHVFIDMARGCLAPWHLMEVGEPHYLGDADSNLSSFRAEGSGERAYEPSRSLERRLPCRACPVCLEHRGKLWAARSIAEFQAAIRGWLVTLTYNPAVRSLRTAAARVRVGQPAWDRLSKDQQTAEIIRECGRDVTLFTKTVRNQMAQNAKIRGQSPGLRVMTVAEAHKDGFPHFHSLLLETLPGVELRKAVIDAKWPHGFSTAKLVDSPKGASYAAKYLSKDARSRVRASAGFGDIAGPETPDNATPKF